MRYYALFCVKLRVFCTNLAKYACILRKISLKFTVLRYFCTIQNNALIGGTLGKATFARTFFHHLYFEN